LRTVSIGAIALVSGQRLSRLCFVDNRAAADAEVLTIAPVPATVVATRGALMVGESESGRECQGRSNARPLTPV